MFLRFSKRRLSHIDDYFSTQLSWIRIVGLAVPESRRQRCLLALYRVFILLVMFHVACLFAVTVYLDVLSGSFEAVAYSLPQMVVMMISTFYLAYFQTNTAVYIDLMAYMNRNFHFRSAKGISYVTSQWTFEVCNALSMFYIFLALVSTGIVSVVPLFQSGRELPLRCWYPFDQTVSPFYELLYASQILIQIIMPLSFCQGICLPMAMAFLLCGQYDILFCSLRNVPWTAVRFLSPTRAVAATMMHAQS